MPYGRYKYMPQLHFYISEEAASVIRKRAEAQGISLSRFVANLVQREVSFDWPEGFFEKVAGGWKGEPLERPVQGEYEQRETF
jgi:hypothetical protein